MRFTARARLETWAHASRVQSEDETYELERTVVGSVVAGVTAYRCGECGACDRSMVSVAVGDWEAGDMEMNERNKDAPTQAAGGPFAWLVKRRWNATRRMAGRFICSTGRTQKTLCLCI